MRGPLHRCRGFLFPFRHMLAEGDGVRWWMMRTTSHSGSAIPLALMLAALARQAQPVLEPPDCGADGRFEPYHPLREADVAWERRVWRVLDLADPANAALRRPVGDLPGCSGLFDLVRQAAQDGRLTVYAPADDGFDDAFRAPMTPQAMESRITALGLGEDSIVRWMLKEDWLFDRARSTMEARIIALAPMAEVRGTEGELRGYAPILWVHYPSSRALLARHAAMRRTDGERLSYEAWFAERFFSGAILKVAGMHDAAIPAVSTGLDALIRSEAERERLQRMGFDLWNH